MIISIFLSHIAYKTIKRIISAGHQIVNRKDMYIRNFNARSASNHYCHCDRIRGVRSLGIDGVSRFAFLLVHKQAAGVAVSGAAQFTDVRLFSGVREGVILQVLVPDEGLAASVAMIIRLARVSSQMILQPVRGREGGATVVADQVLVARMDLLVSLPVTRNSEALAAVSTGVRFDAVMRFKMQP